MPALPDIGPYRNVTRIAIGGMAEVYRALKKQSAGADRAVVIKRLLPQIAEGVDVSIPQAGHLISAYALGVVVGAPLLAALGQDEEVAMHVRATANTGATREDIREALLHVAIYAGVPAANHAIKIAKRVFEEMDAAGTAKDETGR